MTPLLHILIPTLVTTGTTTTTTTVSNALRELDLRPLRSAPAIPEQKIEEVEGLVPKELRHAKWAALIDGGWSVMLTVAWGVSAKLWEPPYPEGIVGLAAARILYGTTYSILVATEISLLGVLAGEDLATYTNARLENHWMFGFDVPGPCSGSYCGLGLGGYSELNVRVLQEPIPVELLLTAGWIQGHFDSDERLTLIESTWVETPIIARGHLPLTLGPVHLELAAGAGLYFGLHNAHIHASSSQVRRELDAPFWEMVVLHGGVGPGLHGRLWISLFDYVVLDAGIDVAPLLLGGTNKNVPSAVLVLRPFEHDGIVFWRRASVGLRLKKVLDPVTLGVRMVGAQLSPGPLTTLGHKAFVVQFAVPFVLQEEE